jgi:hypothetical protein
VAKQPQLKITAVGPNGTAITGLYVVLEQSSNSAITKGYTPATFNVTVGQKYTITATDSGNVYFNHWTNGFTVRVMPITITAMNTTFTAAYADSVQPPPEKTPYSITVTSHDLNGTAVSGFYIDVRVNGYHVAGGDTPVTFSNLEPGVPFQIIAYWYGNYWLREFSNGDLNRYGLVTFNSTGPTTATYDALYQYVPPSQAAALNIGTQFPNGTVIGTTFNNTSYIQHTPGMWLTVTPPNSSTPFTGTFTGGSILPFILIKDQNYTVSMTKGYGNCLTFWKWQDTNGTDPVRVVPLYGNVSLIAIYTQTGTCPAGYNPRPSASSAAGVWTHSSAPAVAAPLLAAASIQAKPTDTLLEEAGVFAGALISLTALALINDLPWRVRLRADPSS